MSLARRWLLLMLMLCIPLQSTLALVGTICDSISVGHATMPMLSGHHDHAAMLAAQRALPHDKAATAHPMSKCEHCAHCPACSFSTCNSTLTATPIFYSFSPQTAHSDDALISLVLDTPQRPPRIA